MKPRILSVDPQKRQRFRSSRRSLQYWVSHLGELQKEYPKKFVVIYDGKLVAAHRDPAKAKAKAQRKGGDLTLSIIEYVPGKDEHFFF